jgi:hypothetical protein
MEPLDLERQVHQRLQQLPTPRAPRTLLPRVMEAVARMARPWYARSWFTWPRAWQFVSAAALVVFVIALGALAPVAEETTGEALSGVEHTVVRPAAGAALTMASAAKAVGIVWRTFSQTLFGVIPVLFFTMCVATVLLSLALGRVALGRVYQI